MPLDAAKPCCYTAHVIRRSSAVEQLTVNQLVVGSIPTAGANNLTKTNKLRADRLSDHLLDFPLGGQWGAKLL